MFVDSCVCGHALSKHVYLRRIGNLKPRGGCFTNSFPRCKCTHFETTPHALEIFQAHLMRTYERMSPRIR